MKTNLAVAFFLLLVILLTGALLENKTREVSQQYVSAAEEILALSREGQWQRAGEAASAYSQAWEDTMGWMQLVLNHSEGDDVTMALAEIEAAVSLSDIHEVTLQCTRLRQHALHLHHRDAFTLGNVL